MKILSPNNLGHIKFKLKSWTPVNVTFNVLWWGRKPRYALGTRKNCARMMILDQRSKSVAPSWSLECNCVSFNCVNGCQPLFGSLRYRKILSTYFCNSIRAIVIYFVITTYAVLCCLLSHLQSALCTFKFFIRRFCSLFTSSTTVFRFHMSKKVVGSGFIAQLN